MRARKLGELLVAKGVLDSAALETALAIQPRTGKRLGAVLRAHGYCPSLAIAAALAEQARFPFVEDERVRGGTQWSEPLAALTLAWCRRHAVLPTLLDGQPHFCLEDPFNLTVIDHLRGQWPAGAISVTTPESIAAGLGDLGASAQEAMRATISTVETQGVESGQIPVMVRGLIDRALDRRASDIHIEPLSDSVMVRARVDGLLETLEALPRGAYRAVINVLWEWAALPHGETHRILDGHLRHTGHHGTLDIRLSAIPGEDGPSIVLRLLGQRRSSVQLSDLGYTESRARAIASVLRAPHGLLLVTGPTGSGKTTTLYAIINALNDRRVKVVTVEDPVEVRLARVQQVTVHDALGITFGTVTRAFLRHDPDVVLIGEIRDADTAREAVRAALTGRKVLSTLHTQDALTAIPRLLELGVEPGLLAQTLTGVVAQRLVRLRCKACVGAGCAACGNSGEVGRTVVSEVLTISAEMRAAIEQRTGYARLHSLVMAEGFSTMADDAAALIDAGRIGADEADRILGPLVPRVVARAGPVVEAIA